MFVLKFNNLVREYNTRQLLGVIVTIDSAEMQIVNRKLLYDPTDQNNIRSPFRVDCKYVAELKEADMFTVAMELKMQGLYSS